MLDLIMHEIRIALLSTKFWLND